MERRNSKIVSKEDVPQWMVDNDHLHYGYRINFHSKRKILKSMCMKHNETMNFWTHFIGAIVFAFLIFFLIRNKNYSTEIYKELKKDFEHFQLKKFNEIFKDEILNFVDQLKDQAKIQNSNLEKIKNQSKEFLHLKIEHYKDSLKEFKNNIKHKKEFLQKNYDEFFDTMILCKECLKENLNYLKISSNEKFDKYKQKIDKWFIEHKEQLLDKFPKLQDVEYYPMIVYMLSALLCLGFSAVFHLFYPLSRKTNDILQRLDMAGISILIFGSCFTCSYYIYYCELKLLKFYTAIQFITCFGVFIATLFEKFHKKEFVHIKGLMFGALGLGNGLSFMHGMYIFKYQQNNDIFDNVFKGAGIMGALYLIGLFFYIKKIPERLAPRKFDIWLNSHTIFHIFVFVAAIHFYYTLNALYEIRSKYKCF